jgi:hypothetical protein
VAIMLLYEQRIKGYLPVEVGRYLLHHPVQWSIRSEVPFSYSCFLRTISAYIINHLSFEANWSYQRCWSSSKIKKFSSFIDTLLHKTSNNLVVLRGIKKQPRVSIWTSCKMNDKLPLMKQFLLLLILLFFFCSMDQEKHIDM